MPCKEIVLFFDCKGSADLICEIVNLCFTTYVLSRAIKNCYQFHRAKGSILQTQTQQSRTNKLKINLFCAMFLVALFGQISFSMINFLVMQSSDYGMSIISQTQINASIAYKVVQITCITILNCLLLYVGYTYWRIVVEYLDKKGDESKKQIMFSSIYNQWFIRVFYCQATYNSMIIFVSIAMLCISDNTPDNIYYFAMNCVEFSATFLSIIYFAYFRVNYYRVIGKNVQINKKEWKIETFYTTIIVLTCICRLLSYITAIIDFSTEMRDFDESCFDKSFNHALYIFYLTAVVNLIPSFIITKIFKSRANNLSQSFSSTDSSFIG